MHKDGKLYGTMQEHAMSTPVIELDGFDVSADEVIAVARHGASVVLSAAARHRLIDCRPRI